MRLSLQPSEQLVELLDDEDLLGLHLRSQSFRSRVLIMGGEEDQVCGNGATRASVHMACRDRLRSGATAATISYSLRCIGRSAA